LACGIQTITMFSQIMAGYVLYYCNPLVFLYLSCFVLNFRYYFISEQKERMLKIMTKLNKTVWTSCTKNASGKEYSSDYFFGWKAFGYIDHSYDETKLYIVTTPSYYAELTKCDDVVYLPPINFSKDSEAEVEPRNDDPKFVEIFVRRGSYKNFFYTFMRVNLSNITPLGDQISVVTETVALFRKRRQGTVFLHGVSNAGKSMVGYLVAKELGGKFCHFFNPTEPGDQIHNLVADASPTDDSPLVVVLEEVDIILHKIHHDAVVKNREVATSVHDKTGWCNFLDNMVFMNNVLLIMTSNKSKADLDALDPAYLRKGRIHAEFRMDKVLDEVIGA